MTHSVLVVDDSAVVRKLIRDRLASDPGLVVMGHARNGEECLEKIARAKATGQSLECVILDEEMPVMTGREVLKIIRRDHPELAVVLFSAHVEIGSEGTLDALFLGADDAVRKPSALGDSEDTWQELIEKVYAAVERHSGQGHGMPTPTVAPSASFASARARERSGVMPRLLVVGSSTGGPAALTTWLDGLREPLTVPVVIAQHMPPVFTARLAERLDRHTSMPVNEAVAGETLRPGEVWIAPGDYHVAIEREGASLVMHLNQEPPENSCRPAVDVLFRSAAAAEGPGVLAVVFTGMGQDGMLGAGDIVDQGGAVIVQDEASSVVWGMPGAIVASDLADEILPLDRIADEVVARTTLAGIGAIGGRR